MQTTQAAAGRMVYDTADMERLSRPGAAAGDAAAVAEGTHLCCTRRLQDMLHCLGGVTVLLPLLAQLGAAAPLSPKYLTSWN